MTPAAASPDGKFLDDAQRMRRALQLARRGWQKVSPNPLVGAVLVQAGEVIGEGYHRRLGGPHAEVEALRDARKRGEASRIAGADLFVTLEPCDHHGRTPPCTEAILEARLRRVVYAVADPNPQTRGLGPRKLQQAGIEVVSGILEDAARDLNAPYFFWRQTGRPWVLAKWAMSLDGKIATRTGDSRWITGEKARRHAHALRRRVDAILVGTGTCRRDDPSLLPRPARGRRPLRVVLDRRGELPPGLRVFQSRDGERLCAISSEVSPARRGELERLGVEVVEVPSTGDRLDVAALLGELGARGVSQVLVEGGGALHGSLRDAGLIQEVAAFIAPRIVGGAAAPGPVGGSGPERIADALELESARLRRLGDDWVVEGRVRR